MYYKKYDTNKKMAWENNYKHPLILIIILLGALNWGFMVFNLNPIEMLSNLVNTTLGSNFYIDKIIYIIIVIVSIIFASRYESWYPIYDKTKFPSSLIPLSNPVNTNKMINIKTKPNSKIAYWTTLPSNKILTSDIAYGKYSNSGVVMSDKYGNATLSILDGNDYIEMDNTFTKKNINYRIIGLPYDIMGPIIKVNY
jgi:uncharacterized membrane protein YuzA (DUF378 family)